jgi:hypothetical protein
MKLFYDTSGNVIGSFEGATDAIESSVGLPSSAIGFLVAPKALVDRLNDPLDPLHPHDLTVAGNEIESRNQPTKPNPTG